MDVSIIIFPQNSENIAKDKVEKLNSQRVWRTPIIENQLNQYEQRSHTFP